MEPVIRCKIIRHTHVFQPGNVVEVRRRIIEKSENQPVSGYYIPDIGDGTPGTIPLDAAEPVADNAIPGDSYYGKCVLTSVSNYYKNPGEAGSSLQTGIIKPENVRIIHYVDCQQLVFHMPAYAWDAGTFRLTNTCSGEVLEEKPVRDRLNGGTMILTNTLPYRPGFYAIEADWPDGRAHRISFIKFSEGFPKAPFENATAAMLRAIRNEEVHLYSEPGPSYSSPPCLLPLVQHSDDQRLRDYQGIDSTTTPTENGEKVYPTSGISATHPTEENLAVRPTSGIFPTLEYTQSGRGGSIYYHEGPIRISFGWEFGGGSAVAILFMPETKHWEAQTGTPLARRDEILRFVCEQVIRDQAPGCRYEICENSISIVR